MGQKLGKIDWDQVSSESVKKRTKWSFAPAGCQYRDGLSKSLVKATKTTLINLKEGMGLNFAQLQVLLSHVANIINERPVGVQVHNKAEGPTRVFLMGGWGGNAGHQ